MSRLFKKTNAHRLLVSPGSAVKSPCIPAVCTAQGGGGDAVKSPYVPAVCTAQGGGGDAVCAVTPRHCSMLGALGRVGRDNLKPAANGRYLVSKSLGTTLLFQFYCT